MEKLSGSDGMDSSGGLNLITKTGGTLVFLGGMNAMPMMYALELKKFGYDVIYFVDAKIKDKLSRPENHFGQITYPYPEWIIEWTLTTQIILVYFRRILAKRIDDIIYKKTSRKPQAYILNGFFVSLSPFLTKQSTKIFLSHGSDLDVWCDIESAEKITAGIGKRSFFKLMPRFVSRWLICLALKRQYEGAVSCNKVVYFPKGFDPRGDFVVSLLKSNGVKYYERYDISFAPLFGRPREFKSEGRSLNIFSGVRFLYKTFPEGNEIYNKGNDIIISGLAKYYKYNKNIIVHFVEKGEDVNSAKMLCDSLGISDIVVWHKEMSFKELLNLYDSSDICFDQVGSHWIGAIGAYAMWLGKPLIANAEPLVKLGVWPTDNPVCSATNADDVCNQLIALTDCAYRKIVSQRSKLFAEKNMSSQSVLHEVFGVDLVK